MVVIEVVVRRAAIIMNTIAAKMCMMMPMLGTYLRRWTLKILGFAPKSLHFQGVHTAMMSCGFKSCDLKLGHRGSRYPDIT